MPIKSVATFDPIDTITMDIPLLVRIMELSRETLKSDDELHVVVEKLINQTKVSPVLTMKDYEALNLPDAY